MEEESLAVQTWLRVKEEQLKKEAELKALRIKRQKRKEEKQWEEYMEQLRLDATKPGAPAAVRELYAKLKGKLIERKKLELELSPDEIARRNLLAEEQLKKEGYLLIDDDDGNTSE